MTPSEANTMVQLMRARYEAQHAVAQPILAAEAKLRADIAALERKSRSCARNEEDLTAMRPLGADVLWTSWVERQHRSLNIRLAQVLVKKTAVIDELRQAHGRLLVAEKLQAATLETLRKRRDRNDADTVLEHLALTSLKRGTAEL